MGKFPRNYAFPSAHRKSEEFESLTSEMLAKVTKNMSWTLWPTSKETSSVNLNDNGSEGENMNGHMQHLTTGEVGAPLFSVNGISSNLSMLNLKQGSSVMLDAVDSTALSNKSSLMEPFVTKRNNYESKKRKYSREFLLSIRQMIDKRPFTGVIQCPDVVRGNNDHRNIFVNPRRGQHASHSQTSHPHFYHQRDNHHNFNRAPVDMNFYYTGNGSRNEFSNSYNDNNSHRWNGGGGRQRHNSQGSNTSNSNNTNTKKIKPMSTLLPNPRALRDSTQVQTPAASRYVMEPLLLKKQKSTITEVLQMNASRSILPLKVIKK